MKHQNNSINTANNTNISGSWDLFISKGDDDAFSQIYYQHFDMLYYVGQKYISDTQVIEDAIQNVFVYLLKKRKSLNSVANVRAYLLKSFRRQLFHDLKKQKKFVIPDRIAENQIEYYNSIEHSVIENEEVSEIQSALKKSLGKLSAKQQEIIYLRFDCEMSYEEISGILDITVDSCYKSIYRLIKIIKADIELMNLKGKNFFFWFVGRLEKSL